MKYSFKEYLQVLEAVKDKTFNIEVDNIVYKVIRDNHLLTKRKGDNKPKDFKMSKEKYKKLIISVLNSNLNLEKPISITWVDSGKSNVISLDMKDNNTFSIFGAIMNSDKSEDELYKAAEQRLKINLKD